MHERDLRAVLLVKAIEETDLEGALVPAADRLNAAREAKRAASGEEAILAHRAHALAARLAARHPFIEEVLALVGGATWVSAIAIFLALLAGIALSALDGTRRINVLAFPLVGLVLWNLFAYAVLAQAWLHARRAPAPRWRWLPEAVTGFLFGRVLSLVGRSKVYNAPLADALGRFVREWSEAARPLLLARASRVLHLCAAAVGLGLVAGLYARGIAFDYRAGWESTFLSAPMAKAVLSILYGPAAWLTGIEVPDAAHLEAIRWRDGDGQGGESAARWIHLLAATAMLLVVLPRLALAALASLHIAHRARNLAVPPSASAHGRAVFGPVGGLLAEGKVMVVPYAYEPGSGTLARLRAFIGEELGAHLAIDLRSPVRYGDEEPFLQGLAGGGGEPARAIVLVVNLAATAEEENHGRMIEGLRDAPGRERSGAKLLVVADEGPYAARMSGPGGAGGRLEERRRAWRAFAGERGVEARFVNLGP